VTAPARPARVLLGNLEPIALIGMRSILGRGGIEIVGEEQSPAALVGAAGRLAPDAVVLALDERESRDLGELVRAIAPGAKLVFWASSERQMEVLDPGAATPRRLRDAAADRLHSELTNDKPPHRRTD
jgi:DNA-binding NarL/FixJ family response regulator